MIALITGGSKGIGAAIAEYFLDNDIDCHINARNRDDLEAQHRQLSALYPHRNISYSSDDLSTADGVFTCLTAFTEAHSSLDILVNNAGVYIGGNTVEEADGVLEKMIDTNLYSAYRLTRACLPMLRKSKSAHIFNMCSIASKIAYPNGGSYSISKFALYGYTKVLREELKQESIKVTAILPGATWSNSWAGVDLPEERLMQAKDIAIAVYHAVLMSPSAVVEEIIVRPQLGDL